MVTEICLPVKHCGLHADEPGIAQRGAAGTPSGTGNAHVYEHRVREIDDGISNRAGAELEKGGLDW
jgi:hypothetical protein